MADEIMKLYGEKPIFTSKIAFVSNRDGNDEIYMMDYDGGGPDPDHVQPDQGLHARPGPPTSGGSSTRPTSGAIPTWSSCPSTRGRARPVAGRGTNFSGAFSPDGKKLAFCSTMDGNAEIYTAEASTDRKIKRLTFNAAIETAPSWSPTGREIAFTSDRLGTGTPQIYIMDAEGSNVRKVSFGGNYHDAPAWSPTASGSPSSPGSTTSSTSTS